MKKINNEVIEKATQLKKKAEDKKLKKYINFEEEKITEADVTKAMGVENTVATKQLEKYIPDKTEMITQDVVDAATQLKEELAPYKLKMMRTIDINKTKERKTKSKSCSHIKNG